ncbi:MAG: type II secretion system F family protein [Phycisphaeraceae bacterium]
MNELLLPILTFLAVMCLGGALVVARSARREPLQARLRSLEAALHSGLAVPEDDGLGIRLVRKLGMWTAMQGPSAQLRAELARAGYHGRRAAEVFLGMKLVLLAVGLIALTAGLAPLNWGLLPTGLLIIFGAAGMSFLPNIVLGAQQRKRSRAVRGSLPDAVDLLEICVSAGMGMDMAWNAVTDEIRGVDPILADEMALANLEIHLGAQRHEVMRHMADRTGADELASLAAVLVQSERFGTSMAEALRTFAATMREMRSQRAEESAEKMAVKILVPMVVFIFPAVLIATAGPACLRLIELFNY